MAVCPASEPAAGTTGRSERTRIIGVDVGLHRTGYAVLDAAAIPERVQLVEAGVIRIARTPALEYRLVELETALATLVREHAPEALACEDLYAHYKHPRTAIRMGHARGVVLALAVRSGLRVSHISATQIKKMLTGNGHASKSQMQRAVAGTLRLAVMPEPHDVADAIAVGLAGLRLLDAEQRTTRTNAATTGKRAARRGRWTEARGSLP